MIRLLPLLALIGLSLPAYAQGEPSPALTDALQQCIEAVNDSKGTDDGSGSTPGLEQCIAVGSNVCQEEPGGSSTQGVVACNGQEQAFWDDLLNYAYGELETALDADVFQALKAAQKAWIPWRDANCRFVYLSTEGTIAQILASYCMMETTARRAADLLNVLDEKAGSGDEG